LAARAAARSLFLDAGVAAGVAGDATFDPARGCNSGFAGAKGSGRDCCGVRREAGASASTARFLATVGSTSQWKTKEKTM